jgi:hypothetical protein
MIWSITPENVMQTPPTNPYDYLLPVDSEMSFGRQNDVETLTETLTEVRGNSIALIGGRRMGKTSLLEMMLKAWDSQTDEPTSGVVPLPIFIDLTGHPFDSVGSFFRTVGQEAHGLLADLLDAHPDPFPDLRADEPPAPTFHAGCTGDWRFAD